MNDRHVHEPYIYASIAIALTAGFGYASIIVGAIALHLPIGEWWIALIQVHGYAQLFGWAGLFIFGVGLFFLPRLRGTTLVHAELAPWTLMCLVVGIALRALVQPLSAMQMSTGTPFAALVGSGWLLSAVLECTGVALIIVMIVSSFRRAGTIITSTSPIYFVRPFLAVSFISLGAAVLLNAALSVSVSLSGGFVFPSSLDDVIVDLMIYGFILPMTFAFSVRNLPLFMRLTSPPTHSLLLILASYVAVLLLRLVAEAEQVFKLDFLTRLGGLGSILQASAVLVFIWQLDVLLRRKRPWTDARIPTPPEIAATRKPTRKNYPDYGEYGRFELLIISAYTWLVFACVIAFVNGAATLFTTTALFNPDIERHAITVGFITMLIFGMAARMVPGFSGKRQIASPRLVMATFYLGNLAVLFRVAPLLAPDNPGLNIAFGLSGAIGWLAVACLAVNLGMTFRQK